MSLKNILLVLDAEHEDLGVSAKMILLLIAEQGGDDGDNAWPSIERLARRAGVSERTVQARLRWLEKRGWIETVRNGGGTRYTRDDSRPNLYKLNLVKLTGCKFCTPVGERGADSAPRGVQKTTSRGADSAPEPVLEPVREPVLSSEAAVSQDSSFHSEETKDASLVEEIARGYRKQNPLSNYKQVCQIVAKALDSRYTELQIIQAMERLLSKRIGLSEKTLYFELNADAKLTPARQERTAPDYECRSELPRVRQRGRHRWARPIHNEEPAPLGDLLGGGDA